MSGFGVAPNNQDNDRRMFVKCPETQNQMNEQMLEMYNMATDNDLSDHVHCNVFHSVQLQLH